jgi:hypothetical protein
MRRRNLLLVLCVIVFTKFSFGRINYFALADTTAPQDGIAMNYTSYVPFSDKIGSSRVYIWPNPAKDKIRIYVNSLRENEQGECLIYSNGGTPVLMHPVLNGTNEIILGNIPNGTYVVAIANKKKDVIVKRFIVAR